MPANPPLGAPPEPPLPVLALPFTPLPPLITAPPVEYVTEEPLIELDAPAPPAESVEVIPAAVAPPPVPPPVPLPPALVSPPLFPCYEFSSCSSIC